MRGPKGCTYISAYHLPGPTGDAAAQPKGPAQRARRKERKSPQKERKEELILLVRCAVPT